MKAGLTALLSGKGAELLRRILEDPADDLAISGAAWLREAEAPLRIALLEQRALRRKGLRKHSRAGEMLFTPLGLQQMTPEILSRYKAARLPAGVAAVADLCCGLGGDSLHVAPGVFVVGVDKSREALTAYRHNVGLFRGAAGALAEAGRFAAAVDGILVDPARRSLESARRGERDYDAEPEPGWRTLVDLVRRFGNAAVKLGPGARLPEEWAEEEREYLGLRDECLELTVRTGSFGRPGMVRAAELPAGAVVEAPACDLPDSFGRVEPPGAYVYEPVKCVVRAHLFGVLAQREGLWQLDGRIAYLSGDRRLESPLLKRYRLLKVLPLDESLLRREVEAREAGTLEIKKRGVEADPEAWRRKLKPRGPGRATLILTRVQGKALALWTEREGAADVDAPGN